MHCFFNRPTSSLWCSLNNNNCLLFRSLTSEQRTNKGIELLGLNVDVANVCYAQLFTVLSFVFRLVEKHVTAINPR